MNVLTSYLVKDILKSAAVAMLLLLTLFNLFTLSDELDDIGKGDYGITDVMYFLVMTTPTVFYELMPAVALVGSLFALGALANHQELIAMRAAGWSVFSIIKAVWTAGLIMVVISVLVGEFIAPVCEEKAQLQRAIAQHNPVVMRTKYGLWLREGKQFINIRKIEDNGNLADLSIYQMNEAQQLQQVMHAEQAVFMGDNAWQLHTIKRSLLSKEQVQAEQLADYVWHSSIAPDLLKIVVVIPDNLSLYDLAVYIQFLKENHQKAHKFEMAFWGRVINPLVIFVMLLVSTPFVVGVKRGVSTGARLLIGVVIGLGFNIIDMTTGHLALIYNLSPWLMALLPSVTFSALAWVALKRVQ